MVDVMAPERIHRRVARNKFHEKERHADRIGRRAFEPKDAGSGDMGLLADEGEGMDFVDKSLARLMSAAMQLYAHHPAFAIVELDEPDKMESTHGVLREQHACRKGRGGGALPLGLSQAQRILLESVPVYWQGDCFRNLRLLPV